MYQKLHWKLTLFATLVTGCILACATFLCLFFFEGEQEQNQYVSFLNNTETTLSHIENQDIISHQWLSQMEAGSQCMIQIYDNGTPLRYQQLKRTGRELSTIGTAAELAKEKYGIDLFTPPASGKLPKHTEYSMEKDGSVYYTSAAVLPSGNGYLGVLLLHSTDTFRQNITKQRLLFFLADIGAAGALFLFFWFFTGRLLRPLEESRERQSSFIASASHELRAPLAVILSALSALRSAGEPDRQRFLAMMQSEGKRMSRLIDDMLFLANSDAGSWRLSMRETEMDTLLLDVFEKFETEAAKKQRRLSISFLEKDAVRCVCDSQRITQVLCILLDNALSYAPCGSQILLSLGKQGEQAIFRVCDHGPGIPEKDREKIFERFYRAENSRSDKAHFGLGLCIAKEIVEAHGGQIRVTGNRPSGAVFSFTVPLRPGR